MTVHHTIVRVQELPSNGGGVVLASAPFDTLQYGFVLNGPGSFDMTMPMRETGVTLSNFYPGTKELYVNRDGVDVWGGYLWTAQATGDDNTVRIGGEGFFSKLNHRFIGGQINDDLFFPDVEQFDIVWTMIDYTQTRVHGDMGFTRGAMIPGPPGKSGVTRNMKYRWWEMSNIGEQILNLAQTKDGFDFDITADKKFKVWSPKRGDDLSSPANDMVLDVNMSGISWDIDALSTASVFYAIGAGDNEATCIAIATNGAASTLFGRLEAVEDFTNIRHMNHLQKKADRRLSVLNDATSMPQCSLVIDAPEWVTYNVGDRPIVKVTDGGFLNTNQRYRISAFEVHLAQSGEETVTAHFDARLLADA